MGVLSIPLPLVLHGQRDTDQSVRETENHNLRISPVIFEATFEFLMEDLFNCDPTCENFEPEMDLKNEMIETWDRQKSILMYNVPHGKKLRGRLLVSAFMQLVPDASKEREKLACMLGWSLEILQAAYLVADDIMDNGHLRRGKPCWHRLENVGISAINDSFLLEHAAYQIIHKYFHHIPCYTDLLDLLLGITFKTILGQSLDIHSSMKNIQPNNIPDPFENFNDKLYNSIVRFKTGYYTCFLPVALAMSLAGISRENNSSIWNQVEQVTLAIGHLFQIQDDYFDCFGDESVIGKIGSDIQEGKCTWLFVTAKKELQAKQDNPTYKILVENYGKLEEAHVSKVKQIYNDLGLPKIFENYQKKIHKNIQDMNETVDHPVLRNILSNFLDQIYKRIF